MDSRTTHLPYDVRQANGGPHAQAGRQLRRQLHAPAGPISSLPTAPFPRPLPTNPSPHHPLLLLLLTRGIHRRQGHLTLSPRPWPRPGPASSSAPRPTAQLPLPVRASAQALRRGLPCHTGARDHPPRPGVAAAAAVLCVAAVRGGTVVGVIAAAKAGAGAGVGVRGGVAEGVVVVAERGPALVCAVQQGPVRLRRCAVCL